MINIGLFAKILGKRKETIVIDDWSLFYKEDKHKTAYKRVAIESVISFIARIIIQSEFRIRNGNKKGKRYEKNKTYYKLNLKPNLNQTASTFWFKVIHKLIYDGECLVIVTREKDLLIADDYMRHEFAVKEDYFTNVLVGDLEFNRTFTRSEVLFFEYGNEELSHLIDSLFYDYGDLIRRLFEGQLVKNQIRATVDVSSQFAKNEDGIKKLQNFINRTYNAIREKVIAIIPQQDGLKYEEHSKQASSGYSVDEINKMTDGFLDQICHAVGLPPELVKGEMADIENMTRNAMKFCIDPILKIISDELNVRLIKQSDYLNGKTIFVKRISYRDMFDVAVAADKLRASAIVDGHELRDELGLEYSDDSIHDEFILTKNYETTTEGGDDD